MNLPRRNDLLGHVKCTIVGQMRVLIVGAAATVHNEHGFLLHALEQCLTANNTQLGISLRVSIANGLYPR